MSAVASNPRLLGAALFVWIAWSVGCESTPSASDATDANIANAATAADAGQGGSVLVADAASPASGDSGGDALPAFDSSVSSTADASDVEGEPRDAEAGVSDAQSDTRDAQSDTRDAQSDAHEAGIEADAAAGDAALDLRCQANAQVAQKTDYAQPGPYKVGTLDVTFEDDSRPITATAAHAAADARTLVTTLYYPASDATQPDGSASLADGGPFPLLMYSHGYSSSRDEASRVADRATSYGYIVVAPDFPLTNLLSNGGSPDVNDAANQPGDISFLIDQVLSFSRDPSHLLANAIDEERIGALGVSLGGLTTLLVSFHPRLHDPRIKVAMPIAALSSFFAEGFYHTRPVPLLLAHGDMDAFIDYEHNARRAFTRAAPNARLITVAKGTHAAFGAQFDPSLLPVLNALIGAPGADPNNPDGVGCGAVGETLSETGGEFLAALGGPEDFIDPGDASLPPCQGDEYTRPAIDPDEQEDIVVRGAVAFFDAHFAKAPETRHDGCRYLLYELPKTPAVTLE